MPDSSPAPQTAALAPTQVSAIEALCATEMRYRRLFEAAQDGILLLNADTGQIEDANPYLIDMLGYTHAELLGKKLWEVGAFADVGKSSDMFAELQKRGYVRYSDLPLRTRFGLLVNVEFVSNSYDCAGVRVIQCNIRNLIEHRDDDAQAHKLSLVVAQGPAGIEMAKEAGEVGDVDQVLLERHRLEELVGTLTSQLAEAQLAAQVANIAKSAFLSNMSHELRTPLAAITGMAHLIRRSQVSDKQADWLSKLELAGGQLLELIDTILDLSRIDAGKFVLDQAAVDIERIAAEVVSKLSDRAVAKGLQLSLDIQPLPVGLVGDPAHLQQALLAYVGNAVKFTPSGSVTLHIRCDEDDADSALLRFEVRDTGIGIEAATLGRLFMPFVQADASASRSYGGAGLGLAIVGRLAELMGGHAGVSSTPGLGSAFWFTARLRKSPHTAALGNTGEASSSEASADRATTMPAPVLPARGSGAQGNNGDDGSEPAD